MTPSELANDLLDETLQALQSLIRRCMKLKQDDVMVLTLSDEIARRVAKDLRLYGGAATSLSPELLSMAAVVRDHSKGGKFVSLPDWNAVTENDPRIKSHPRYQKTLHYKPRSLTAASPGAEHTGTLLPEMITETSAIRSTALEMGDAEETAITIMEEASDITTAAIQAKMGDQDAIVITAARMPAEVAEAQAGGASVAAFPAKTDNAEANIVAMPVAANDTTACTPMIPAAGHVDEMSVSDPDAPPSTLRRHNGSMTTGMELDPVSPLPPSVAWKTEDSISTRSEIRTMDNKLKSGVAFAQSPCPFAAGDTHQRKRQFVSDVEDNGATGTINVKRRKAPTDGNAYIAPATTPTQDGERSRDEDKQGHVWGRDAATATPAEHSVRYHSRKCDKCVKLGVACIVLPDKRYGRTRLVCAKCDERKVTCAIDGVGVRQRMQEMAKVVAAALSGNTPTTRTKTGATTRPKSVRLTLRNTSAMLSSSALQAPMGNSMQVSGSEVMVQRVGSGPPDAPIGNISEPAADVSSAATMQGRIQDLEPTPKDILRSIQDLGNRFDLLATSERVDVIEARVDSVEAIFGH
ncbi:hypothetical protein BDR07DRAFT_1382262, partial [Suillus spraguei]